VGYDISIFGDNGQIYEIGTDIPNARKRNVGIRYYTSRLYVNSVSSMAGVRVIEVCMILICFIEQHVVIKPEAYDMSFCPFSGCQFKE